MAGSRTQTVLPCEDPRGVAVDPTGAVYVLEQKNRRVLKLAAGSSNWTAYLSRPVQPQQRGGGC